MARIFSIQFYYKELLHHAMIAVRETPFHTEYKVSLLNDAFKNELSSDLIISTAKGHFAFANILLQNYSGLMKEIIKAISGHIHSLHH